MEASARKAIIRIECWHAFLLLGMLAGLSGTNFIDPTSLIAGGLFMGLNFFLLSFGIAWVLSPLASNGRIKFGIGLLVLKIVLFLAFLMAIFFRFNLDGISFALGFSTLIVAIVCESVRRSLSVGT